MDARFRRVGEALWDEDEARLRAALAETGAFPRNGVWRGEALLVSVALFLKRVRAVGWPKDAQGLMEWATRHHRAGGPEALSWERRRRDQRRGVLGGVSGEIVSLGASLRFSGEGVRDYLPNLQGRRPT